jgi:hypothetical protein
MIEEEMILQHRILVTLRTEKVTILIVSFKNIDELVRSSLEEPEIMVG